MTRLRSLAAAAVLAITVSACGGDDRTDGEQAYLDALYEQASEAGSGIHGHGDDANVDLAEQVCDQLSDGHAPTEVAQNIESDPAPGVADMASDIVGLAQLHICNE